MAQTPREAAAKKLIGRRIDAAIKARGTSQVRVAKAIGLPGRQGVVSDWVWGKRFLGYANAWKLAEVLGLTVEELFGPPREDERAQYEADMAGHGRLPPDL